MKNSSKTERSPVRVGCGRLVRLSTLAFLFGAQTSMALVMGALGMIGTETVTPACYFAFSNFVIAAIVSYKPNELGVPPLGRNGTQKPE